MNEFPISLDRKEKGSWLTKIVNILIIILIFCILLQSMFYARYSKVYVVGTSMMPMFTGAKSENRAGGDYVYVDRFATPQKGDVIVLSVYDESLQQTKCSSND
jgi:signal peptidase I